MNYFTPFVHIHNQQKDQCPSDRSRSHSEASSFNTEINRLLSAAVVSQRFCNLLLEDPLRAIAIGFNGESFSFSNEETSFLASIKASTLQSFAEQVATLGATARKDGRLENRSQPVPEPAPTACAPAKFHKPKPIVSLSS